MLFVRVSGDVSVLVGDCLLSQCIGDGILARVHRNVKWVTKGR